MISLGGGRGGSSNMKNHAAHAGKTQDVLCFFCFLNTFKIDVFVPLVLGRSTKCPQKRTLKIKKITSFVLFVAGPPSFPSAHYLAISQLYAHMSTTPTFVTYNTYYTNGAYPRHDALDVGSGNSVINLQMTCTVRHDVTTCDVSFL